jgi:hypothetical protein
LFDIHEINDLSTGLCARFLNYENAMEVVPIQLIIVCFLLGYIGGRLNRILDELKNK